VDVIELSILDGLQLFPAQQFGSADYATPRGSPALETHSILDHEVDES
jgi:hypothetical protein